MTPILRRRILLCASLLGVLAGCAPHLHDPNALAERYREAIDDAEVALPAEISQNLAAITAHSPGLIWEGPPGESRIRVVTWTSWNGYDQHLGSELPLGREVWVTLVPEILDFCTRLRTRKADRRTLRLEQLLGLPPDNGKTRFVEFWVRTNDLVRPCPDPEITDRECSLIAPQPSAVLQIDEDYQQWFEQLRSSSYADDGYPWTRLGYTFDWGTPRDEIGLSEFVVQDGSTVEVVAIEPTHEYCRRQPRDDS